MKEYQPDPVVDENNNEVSNEDQADLLPPSRPQWYLRLPMIIALIVLSLTPANGATLETKLRAIRSLSRNELSPRIQKSNDVYSPTQEEICYEQGCLDAAYDLLSAANLSVDPCQDFFEFACGGWVAKNPVPPSASRWSRFNGLRNEVNRITQSILGAPQNINDPRPVNQVKEFYGKCINLEELETVGLAPVTTLLQEFGGWPMMNPGQWNSSGFDWIVSVGELRRRLLDDAMISIYIERDLKNTSRNVVFVDQPSFGLPRSVLINAPAYPAILTAYKTYMVEVAQELGSSESTANLEAAAQAIIDLEILLANVTKSDEDRYEIDEIYHPYTLAEFQTLTDGIDSEFSVDWHKLLSQVFSSSFVDIQPNELVNAAGQSYLLRAISIFKAAEPKVVADYIGWRVATSVIGETTQAMRDITFKFSQVLTGAKEPETRIVSCAGASNNNFGMAIGVKYIEAAFDIEAKDIVDEMVVNLRVSFKELVDEADWLENATRAEALAKADAIRSFMAFPEWLQNRTAIESYYAGLELDQTSHFQSVLNLALWSSDKTLKTLRLPTSQDEWLGYPGIVNAFYSPPHNSITFPAGILQPPFFGRVRPASQNFGGIGVVIGHEITHGFDSQGSQYDKDGNANNWWDEITKEKYQERTQCVIDQYSDFYLPNVDMYVNGELTQGENVADNGGVRQSFRAYRKWVEQQGKEEGRLPGLEFLSSNQLFFLGYANIWCEAITDEGLVNQLLTDPHSPARFRVIGPLRNNVDFAEAYSCPVSDDGMNPPEENKCTVW